MSGATRSVPMPALNSRGANKLAVTAHDSRTTIRVFPAAVKHPGPGMRDKRPQRAPQTGHWPGPDRS